ncbi:hypothetical protein QUF83_21410 [Bacillus cereus]|uniref:hypothetical protein n=1 Tax=Bacillus cereus TaxID=1396 RepID=UPI0025A1999D|nr:hypothetical protein [Bacillus cereus]MDM5238618.1 hypothetical protein [Bacillus cereus]
MTIENMEDIVVRQLEGKYALQEKVFEAKNFTVYIATHIENELVYNRLILIKHLYKEKSSVHIWHKKISREATEFEIAKEVTVAIQSGFKKKN